MGGNSLGASGINTTDEWEYEYDDEETEDFYFTLDVTTLQSQSSSNATHIGKGKAPARPNDQLQVLDLHSDSPLIKLGDCFYSCHWSTDLGTQFYVANPGIDEKPLRRGHVLDVIGISRARLTGEPVTLHRRRPDAPEKAVGSTTADAIVLDNEEDVASNVSTPTPVPTSLDHSLNKNINRLATARQNARDPVVKAQASFLERLAIIKQKKGEKDAVPIFGVDDLSAPIRRGANAISPNGKRKSASNDAFGSLRADNSSKKSHASVSNGASGEPEASQRQQLNSNGGNHSDISRLGSSNMHPQSNLGETGMVDPETGDSRAAAQSGAVEDLKRTKANDATRPVQVEAHDAFVTETSHGQP